MPWKVTDPADARFNHAHFRFTDYSGSSSLAEAARVMFPVGTPKESVDRMMAIAGAETRETRVTPKGPQNHYVYEVRNFRSSLFDTLYLMPAGEFAWKLGIYFDEDDRVVRIVGI